MIFETPRLIVRQLSLADADNFYTLNSDPDIVRFIRPPRTRAESDEKLKEAIEINNTNINGLGGWAVETKGDQNFVGFFGLFNLPESDEVHLGYSLLKHHWGFGFATEFSQAGVDYGFKQLKLHRIIATTFPENIASQKILIKCGFTQIDDFIEESLVMNKYEILNPNLPDNQ